MLQDPFPDPGPDDGDPDGSPLPPAAEQEEGDGPGPEQGLYVCLPAEHLTLAGFAQGGAADTMPPGALLGTPEDAFAADELAAELHLTPMSAADQMGYATTVARRLPRAFAALGAGRIHPVHLRIIEDETSILTDADAAKADTVLAAAAPGMTFGEVRSAAHKLVLKLDPDAVRKRKEAARREAHVRRFREDSGNAGMVARELPSDEVLASWQHVEQRALDLRAAGLPGTLQDLRVRAYLDLLQERDSRLLAADPAGTDGPGGPGGPGNGPGGSPGRGGPAGPGPGPGPRPDAGPSLAALVTITVPLDTWQGRSDTPGEAGGFGLLDGDAARPPPPARLRATGSPPPRPRPRAPT